MAFNVLIVDDSSSMRNIIKKTIEMSGFDVGQFFEGSNGREALAVLDKEWVDVILTDIHMPEMDGIAFLKALQDQAIVSTTPVVIVTTEGREERIEEVFGLGAKACIQKPFRPEEIRKALMNVLGVDEQSMEKREVEEGCDF
ncbi:MAG: response regulator [Deltaproteobacteria bacterium]|nr:response regulator [Deltaproteobacteria bacterium]MBW2019776.1 response regulator [Deltaproteobacteria bacterium]MBW2074656.1 response regulator [Deltaproteobacteria bacterium]RLB83474.1 MAG: response regulator [Deltaproteobacteria bacterium]